MEKLGILIFLPVFLWALETVNLLKDHSFEKDSEVWVTSAGSKWAGIGEDSAIVNRHDSQSSYDGSFSASGDTRITPAWVGMGGFDSAMVVQSFANKKIEDLDSLIWSQKVVWKNDSRALTGLFVIGLFLDASSENWFQWGYSFESPDFDFGIIDRWQRVSSDMPDDTLWKEYARDLQKDLAASHDFQIPVDSFLLLNWGFWGSATFWYGQKVYWDDIRLMGYADYDVGVKEILSGDSLEAGTPYQPVARIKNFGSENADSFLVIAEIKDGASLIYVDTLPWSLDSDTEDTVTFADFDPPFTGPYNLTVRTFAEPDECDEDDELSKEIGHSSVSEVTLPDGLSLEVRSIASPLQVSYSLPYGESGTLTLYDATGRRVERMEVSHSGNTEFVDLASGTYFIKLEADGISVVEKAVVLR